MGRVVRRRRVITIGALALMLTFGVVATASASADSISATCSSGGHSQTCDSSKWYTSAVLLTWQASPPPDSTSGCLLGIAYRFNSNTVTQLSCSGTWGQTTISQRYTIHVEISSPTATATLTRPPDSNAWYNHPVTIAFHGSSFSGIRSCTTATYSGPATPSARVTGSCTDNAGKTVTVQSAAFAYDAIQPSVTIAADTGDRVADLDWKMSGLAPAAGFKLTRQPGLHGKSPSIVYQGGATAFKDTRVRNGVHYLYTVAALDAAGTTGLGTIVAKPGLRLIAPTGAASLSAPPLLRWTADRKADYYNVQLYRGNRKVLSAWPKRAGFQLASRWSYRGHRYRLRPGKYRWYVWPGFGRRSAVKYGAPIGSTTFVVTPSA